VQEIGGQVSGERRLPGQRRRSARPASWRDR